MKIFACGVTAAVPVVMLFLAAAPVMRADSGTCTLSTLQGSFGYTVTGFINAGAMPPLAPGPFAAVGRIVFNGSGG
jgi:hypothetical protein